MLCKIADLLVEVPEIGDMPLRCKEYLYSGEGTPDIVIREDQIKEENWPGLTGDSLIYMDTGSAFFFHLLKNDGMLLHSSAVEMDGKAYLFSGFCGAGKSTHTRLWKSTFGEKAQVFNDDKPALRLVDGKWYAYGAPWCGKDGINQNKKVPLAGICFLKQAKENKIRRLSPKESLKYLFAQTTYKFIEAKNLDLILTQADKLVKMIPIFELENRPEPEAARLSYETMRLAAQEEGL